MKHFCVLLVLFTIGENDDFNSKENVSKYNAKSIHSSDKVNDY